VNLAVHTVRLTDRLSPDCARLAQLRYACATIQLNPGEVGDVNASGLPFSKKSNGKEAVDVLSSSSSLLRRCNPWKLNLLNIKLFFGLSRTRDV